MVKNSMRSRILFNSGLFLAGIVLVLGIYRNDLVLREYRDIILNLDVEEAKPLTISSFELVDHTNKRFGAERLSGVWTFLFFGYTHCPDICPATISQLTLLSRQIGLMRESRLPQFVFVSVDPRRDDTETLSEYMQYFDKRFIGVTGSSENILDFERQLGVFHRYGKKNTYGDYAVSHSTDVFLLNPARQVVEKFRPPINIKSVAERYGVLSKSVTEPNSEM